MKEWDAITYPRHNFNVTSVKQHQFMVWLSNYIPYKIIKHPTYFSMAKTNHVNNKDPNASFQYVMC